MKVQSSILVHIYIPDSVVARHITLSAAVIHNTVERRLSGRSIIRNGNFELVVQMHACKKYILNMRGTVHVLKCTLGSVKMNGALVHGACTTRRCVNDMSCMNNAHVL